jgi:hypothetical protein
VSRAKEKSAPTAMTAPMALIQLLKFDRDRRTGWRGEGFVSLMASRK